LQAILAIVLSITIASVEGNVKINDFTFNGRKELSFRIRLEAIA
jgi:hypothetical protein